MNTVFETLVELETQKNNDIMHDILNDINCHLKKNWVIRMELGDDKTFYSFRVCHEGIFLDEPEPSSTGFPSEFIDSIRKDPSEDKIKTLTKKLYDDLRLSYYLNF